MRKFIGSDSLASVEVDTRYGEIDFGLFDGSNAVYLNFTCTKWVAGKDNQEYSPVYGKRARKKLEILKEALAEVEKAIEKAENS